MGFRSDRRGFTLLEMVIAIAIVLLLTTLGVVSYRRYQWSINLRDTRNTLAGDIKLTQQTAIQNPYPDRTGRQAEYRIEFEDINKKYYIRAYHDNGTGTYDSLIETIKTVSYPKSISIVPADVIAFQQAGVPVGGVAINIAFSEENLGQTRYIEISSKGAVTLKNQP